MNATCERLAGTLRREVPDRILVPGEQHLRAVLTKYQAHDNFARPHQGIPSASRMPHAPLPRSPWPTSTHGRIHRKPVLSGLINEYVHAA
jgi:hypothetical protein